MHAGLNGRTVRTTLCVAVALLGVACAWLWPTQIVRQPIESSYAYDVTDLRLLSGQADNIVIANILGVVGVDEEAGTTSYEIGVVNAIKGDLTGNHSWVLSRRS